MGDYIDPWEKAAHEAADLAMWLLKYGHWLSNNREALKSIGVRPPELHAVALLECATAPEVEAVAAVMDATTDETMPAMISATLKFGELSLEAYAARWAVA